MVLIGIWVGSNHYQVTDDATGKSEVVTILGADDEMNDPVFMQEQTHRAREWVADSWAKAQPKPPLTKDQQHELGEALTDITTSKRHRRETGHGRYY